MLFLPAPHREMERDEEAALRSLKDIRAGVVDAAIFRYGGRIIQSTGDGVLTAFPSVIDS